MKLLSASNNNATSFVLPYRTRFFYEVTEIHTYCLTYAYQAMTLPIVTLGLIGTDGLLISLTLHICGQLSVLVDDIINLEKDSKNRKHLGIRAIVKRHLRLIW